jgi:dihydrofolate reductase
VPKNTSEVFSKIPPTYFRSLDGFAAGPHQSVKNPLGIGGERLHEWALPLAVWREAHGKPDGTVNASDALLRETQSNIGATIMGRHMFGGRHGGWDAVTPWTGWWGDTPPFHHPVFVLTHHARAPLELKGGTSFTFVTDGIESALAHARRAANGMDVALAGGAQTCRPLRRRGRSTWRTCARRCGSTEARH